MATIAPAEDSTPLPIAPTEEQAQPQTVEQAISNDVARGATVHTFNPDATTEQKQAQIKAAQAQLAPLKEAFQTQGMSKEEKETKQAAGGATAVAIDTSSASSKKPEGAITLADLKSSAGPAAPIVVKNDPAGEPGVPGGIPAEVTQGVPDWYKVGWREVSGVDLPTPHILEEYLSEQYYGQTWHHAAVIVFAVLGSHFFARFRFGIVGCLLILSVCATYYKISIERFRRSARDDIQTELTKTRLLTESESADWINNFLIRFWKIYEPVLSATIVASVDAVLSTQKPSFLEDLKLSTFTLGNKAPKIVSVRTFPKTADDEIIMEWNIAFLPHDNIDVTPRDQAFQTNPKIVLEVKVGKGFIAAPFPILLEDISFQGHMRIKMKLINNFPHVSTLSFGFMAPPVFDYVLKPVGGSFGFDINSIPGMATFVKDMVHSNLAPMMYDPNMFTLNLEQMMSGAPLDSSIGVLQLTIREARQLQGAKLGGGTPDPYVSVSLAGKSEVARTKYINSTVNPTWSEVKYLLINSLGDTLTMTVLDWNEHRKDTELGVATFELAKLANDATLEHQEAFVQREGKEKGKLRFDATFYPVLQPSKLPNGTLEPLPETKTGIVRFTLHQAKDLDASRTGQGDCNPYAKVFLGNSKEPIFKTGVLKHSNAPVWETSHEYLVTSKANSSITIRVVDDRDFARDPIIGFVNIPLDVLLAAKESGNDWVPLQGARSGRIRVSAVWKPLAMAGALNGGADYTPPIGILRVHLKKAVDVKNVEAALGGKSDPYVRVMLKGNVMARTEVIDNNLNPEWDQIVYVPVHSIRERVVLEVMDYQHLTKDRSLGSVEVNVSNFCSKGADPRTPYESTGKIERRDKIQLDKGGGYKGELIYEAHFCPAVALDPPVSFEAEDNEAVEAVKMAAENRAPTSSAINETAPAKLTNGSVLPASPTSPTSATAEPVHAEPSRGVKMTREELLQTNSGVLVIQVIEGKLERKGRFEVLFDDGYWPSFGTPKARSLHQKWDQVGEGFVRELDLGRVWLRLNENDEFEKESVFSEIKMDTRKFVQDSLNTQATFKLLATDGSGRQSTVKISSRFVPVDIVLEPRESANNMGTMRIELIEGLDIPSADRNGKSDPFVKFTLNGNEVYKSKTIKKTLHPVWNETFTTEVPSRATGTFNIEVFDWNQVEAAKSLGIATLDMSSLEPFEQVEQSVSLTHPKTGPKGTVKLRIVFQPAIIMKARKNTSTFSGAGRVMTAVPLGVASMGVKGVVGGVGAVGHGVGAVGHGVGAVGSGVGKVFGMGGSRKKTKDFSITEEDTPATAAAVSRAATPPNGTVSALSAVSNGNTGSVSPSTPSSPVVTRDYAGVGMHNSFAHDGTLIVTVLSIADLNEEVRCTVSLTTGKHTKKTNHTGHKGTTHTWDETFQFEVSNDTPSVEFLVYEHKAVGKGKTLGTASVDPWKYVQISGPPVEVPVALEGTGTLKLRLDFRPGVSPNGTPVQSSLSLNRVTSNATQATTSKGSPSKFSLKGRGKKGSSGLGVED